MATHDVGLCHTNLTAGRAFLGFRILWSRMVGMFCQWGASLAAMVGGVALLDNISALGGPMLNAVSFGFGAASMTGTALSIKDIPQIAAGADCTLSGSNLGSANNCMDDFNTPGRYGMSYPGTQKPEASFDGDPVKKDPPKKEPTIYERHKDMLPYLPPSTTFGLGMLACGEAVCNYIADYNPETYKHEVFENFLDVATLGGYSNLKTAASFGNLTNSLANGEYSPSDVIFGLGYASAPMLLGATAGARLNGIALRSGLRNGGFGINAGGVVSRNVDFVTGVRAERFGVVVGEGTVHVRPTISAIESGSLKLYNFANVEGHPQLLGKPFGYWQKTSRMIGYGKKSPLRIIKGQQGEYFLSPDHYTKRGNLIPLNH